MSLKKQRIHITGISNIDYKSKKDIEKIFNNFKNYKIKPDKNNEPLDPTQTFVYKSQKPKQPNMYNVSLKDAVEQDGDSLLYADTYKLRKELRLKRLEDNVNNKLRIKGLRTISKESKDIKNEPKKQSDEMRLKEIRKKVQDELIPHNDIRNIFVSWQKNYLKNDELSLFDLHKKINELGIPISYNEAIALISCANKRNTNSLNLDEFKNLFINGVTRGIFNHKITDPSSKGVFDLKTKLLSDEDFPLKIKKIIAFMTGTLDGEKIWNKGEAYRPCFPEFKQYFNKIGKKEVYDGIIKRCHALHIYRELPNRQGHSNEKPSYWAFGYDSLAEYFNASSESQVEQYKTVHYNCCGVNNDITQTKKEKKLERKEKKQEFKRSQKSSRKSST